MEIDEHTKKFHEIFDPYTLGQMVNASKNGVRFAYYTQSETAMKIINNSEFWLRNVTVMNDYSEIYYGIDLIEKTLAGETGARFREAVDDIYEGTIARASELIKSWRHDWEFETYIACISVHSSSEDVSGRLSMWRAYGDTALVINNKPLMQVTNLLSVFSAPVNYLSEQAYSTQLNEVTNQILINRRYLKELGQDTLVSYLKHMFFNTAISTKHPGFSEEQEWRIYYRPNEANSPIVEKRIVVLNGVPQTIYVLPLIHDPLNGLFGADIPSLLERLIIGPSEHPYVTLNAYKNALANIGVANVEEKVVYSDIPLRSKR